MCATLTYYQALNRRTTNRTGLSLAIIHPEIILKIASAIHPIDTGSVATDTFLQDFPDRFPQGPCLLPINRI